MAAEQQWSGEMLDRPEAVAAFTTQLRRSLAAYVDYVNYVRRDAEAMWRANPPEGYGSFEAWWRDHQITAPFTAIQKHLEEAVRLTFSLEARYRQNRHEIPARRQAAAEARQARRSPALPAGAGGTPTASPAPTRSRTPEAGRDFLDLIRGERSA